MNMYAAIGLGTVALIAAVGLFVAGQPMLAGIAVMLSIVCDVLFVLAVRTASEQRKKA